MRGDRAAQKENYEQKSHLKSLAKYWYVSEYKETAQDQGRKRQKRIGETIPIA